MLSFDELNDLVGAPAILEAGRRYSGAPDAGGN